VIPAPNLVPGSMPLLHQIDIQRQLMAPGSFEHTIHPDTKTIELMTSLFGTISADVDHDFQDALVSGAAAAAKNAASGRAVTAPCTTGRVRVSEQSFDQGCFDSANPADSFQIISTTGSAQYLDCADSTPRSLSDLGFCSGEVEPRGENR